MKGFTSFGRLSQPIGTNRRHPGSAVPASIVLVAEELSPAGIAQLESGFDVRYADGADRGALLPALADADAVIIRSATRIDAEALAHAPRLRVVARAGVGLDNVDVDAATKAGVMVVNAPSSNIVSAAEHAVALLLSVARNVPQAAAALKAGQWKRSAYTGIELQDKVAGLLGLGRIGMLVAQRLAAFGMRVVAYDPYVAAARAAQLASALKEGRVGGAGLDVYASEPCTDSPLFAFGNVVATPHLGASTHEAQEKAGVQVARSVRLALAGEFVPDAVNVQGGAVDELIKPGLPLAEKLGRIFTAVAGGIAARIELEVRGEIAALDVSVLQLAALKGVFCNVVEDPVTYVNAPLLASERGVEVSLTKDEESPDWRNVLTLRGTLPDGQNVSVGGTLTGRRQVEKLVEVNGFDMEITPAEHMVFLTYIDRPGIVGIVGQILGDQRINIAGMQVCRDTMGGHALIVLTVDSRLPADVLTEITGAIGAVVGRAVDLDQGDG